MELSTHRATPWYVGEMNDHGIRVAPVADPRNAVAYAFDEDDAAFIVRAVNNHDALVAALGGLLAQIGERHAYMFDLDEAHAALAQAEAA